MHKAAFLDRDGIINVDHGYVSQPAQFTFVEGIFPLCRKLIDKGYLLVVVTNQSGIGRGMYSEQDFHDLTRWMLDTFKEKGVEIAGVYFCPHHPDKAMGVYQRDCECRKPAPGMLQTAARDLDITLQNSLIIGDKLSDMQAGRNAGLQRLLLVESAYTEGREIPEDVSVFNSIADIPEAM